LGPLLLICGAGGGSYPKRVMRMWLVVIDSGIEVVGRVMAYLWMRLRDSELGRYEGYYGVFRDYG